MNCIYFRNSRVIGARRAGQRLQLEHDRHRKRGRRGSEDADLRFVAGKSRIRFSRIRLCWRRRIYGHPRLVVAWVEPTGNFKEYLHWPVFYYCDVFKFVFFLQRYFLMLLIIFYQIWQVSRFLKHHRRPSYNYFFPFVGLFFPKQYHLSFSGVGWNIWGPGFRQPFVLSRKLLHRIGRARQRRQRPEALQYPRPTQTSRTKNFQHLKKTYFIHQKENLLKMKVQRKQYW